MAEQDEMISAMREAVNREQPYGYRLAADFNDPAVYRVWTDPARFAAMVETIRRFKPASYVDQLVDEGPGYIMHTDATLHLTEHALEMTPDEKRFVLPWVYDRD